MPMGRDFRPFNQKIFPMDPNTCFNFSILTERKNVEILNKLLDVAEKYGIDKLNELKKNEILIPFETTT